jgi:spoIIIJ-associated protein
VEWVEASGKSLPEAKETVLDLLGVAEDDAEFVILSEPKPGLFGRLRGEARVQARVRPVAPPPKRGRRERSDRGGRSRSNSSARREGSSGDTGRPRPTERTAPADADGRGPKAAAASPGSSSGRSSRRRRSRGRGGQNDDAPQDQVRQDSEVSSGAGARRSQPARESEETMERSLSLEEQGEAAREFLSGLIHEFGLEAEVTVSTIDEDTVEAAAAGDDLGLLVGPRGATLAAVQDLTRTFVQRQSESRTDRILVDVGGYREKRAAALKRFTLGIVDEVKASGEERALEPMSPSDRKVIHDTVTEIEGVETRSDGLEPDRYVVIQPVAS